MVIPITICIWDPDHSQKVIYVCLVWSAINSEHIITNSPQFLNDPLDLDHTQTLISLSLSHRPLTQKILRSVHNFLSHPVHTHTHPHKPYTKVITYVKFSVIEASLAFSRYEGLDMPTSVVHGSNFGRMPLLMWPVTHVGDSIIHT